MLRCKAKSINEGNKISKFILFFTKQTYYNKLITNVEVDGKIIKEHNNIGKAQINTISKIFTQRNRILQIPHI